MSEIFVITAPTVESIGVNGRGSITAKVRGYWSRDSMTAYINRSMSYENEGLTTKWSITFSHSSGGRDTNEVADDGEAAINFANAMIGLVEFARKFMADNADQFEKIYQAAREQEKREREEATRKIKEAFSNDVPMGVEGAKTLIQEMLTRTSGDCTSYLSCVSVRSRGLPRWNRISLDNQCNATFYFNGNRISKKELIQKMSELSSECADLN